tara:strand:+ start:1269 stop:1604 length:336 start_codon:yes stop_codon:yes gene_type:complete
MAITRTLVEAVPSENTSDEVERWTLGMTYSQGTEGNADYYESSFSINVESTDDFDGTVNFTELDKAAWSLANLVALCPTSRWDAVFASQYDSVITNPPEVCTPDNEFEIPS